MQDLTPDLIGDLQVAHNGDVRVYWLAGESFISIEYDPVDSFNSIFSDIRRNNNCALHYIRRKLSLSVGGGF